MGTLDRSINRMQGDNDKGGNSWRPCSKESGAASYPFEKGKVIGLVKRPSLLVTEHPKHRTFCWEALVVTGTSGHVHSGNLQGGLLIVAAQMKCWIKPCAFWLLMRLETRAGFLLPGSAAILANHEDFVYAVASSPGRSTLSYH